MASTQHNIDWKILSQNIRGINGTKKWNLLRNKISETNCDFICLQETKRDHFDEAYLRKFCHRKYDNFFHLSNEALGGTITIWQSSKLDGELILDNEYAQMVKFCSFLANESWDLINIYAPCTPSGKLSFLEWFSNFSIPQNLPCIFLRDFNKIRRSENRNKPGGNSQIMLEFNASIS
jgi:exonuclease III